MAWGPAFDMLFQTLLWMLGFLFFMVVGAVVLLDTWGKRAVSKSILGVFIENRKLFSKLMEVDADKAYLGKGDKKEEYNLDDDIQFWAGWPAGLPSMLQVPVRAHLFQRNHSDPLDPSKPDYQGISARSQALLSDDLMIRNTWKEVKEAAEGEPAMAAPQPSRMGLYMLLANIAVSGITLYIVIQIQSGLGM